MPDPCYSSADTLDPLLCYSYSDSSDFLLGISPSQMKTASDHYVVRVFYHIMVYSNGTGSPPMKDIQKGWEKLIEAYEPHGICFSLMGIDTLTHPLVNPSYSFSEWNFLYPCPGKGNVPDCDGDGKFDSFHPNAHPNAIDIYVIPSANMNFGIASWIPGLAVAIGGAWDGVPLVSSHVLSHEIGHCLGLYHTFHGHCGEHGCRELVDGSNCDVCGDYVCDTPADAYDKIQAYVKRILHPQFGCICWRFGTTCNGSPTDLNGDPYDPQATVPLIMAYSNAYCKSYHTPGQGERMRKMLANSPMLQPAIVPENLALSNKIFYTGYSRLYDVTNEITTTDVYIQQGTSITLRAGNKIRLKDGTKIKKGSYFHAYIENTCSTFDTINNARTRGNPSVTSTEILEQTSFRFYPNPTTGISYVELPSTTIYEISVRDLLGREILRKSNLQGKTELNLSGYPKGIYFLQVQTEQGEFFREKVIFE